MMEKQNYFIGLSGNCKFECKDKNQFSFFDKIQNEYVLVEGIVSEKTMTVKSKKTKSDEYSNINENTIEKRVIEQISRDGSRWEGDWYKMKPFGFGSVYNDEGNRIFTGFMFYGKKVGFGTEFFADLRPGAGKQRIGEDHGTARSTHQCRA